VERVLLVRIGGEFSLPLMGIQWAAAGVPFIYLLLRPRYPDSPRGERANASPGPPRS
jgi:hypothetical protein